MTCATCGIETEALEDGLCGWCVCDKRNAERRSLAPARGSAALEICAHCDYWEAPPRNLVDPLGYCGLFDKLTLPGHGLQCTGWKRREPPNEKALRPAVETSMNTTDQPNHDGAALPNAKAFAAAPGYAAHEQEPSVCMKTTGGGEREAELWHQFEEWFVARNRFTPTKGDSRVEELWQAYLCGRVDELQENSLPKNVMRDALKDIQATLDAAGTFLEGVEKERAQRSGAVRHTVVFSDPAP